MNSTFICNLTSKVSFLSASVNIIAGKSHYHAQYEPNFYIDPLNIETVYSFVLYIYIYIHTHTRVCDVSEEI